jgi:hypothetical protein
MMKNLSDGKFVSELVDFFDVVFILFFRWSGFFDDGLSPG